MSKEYMIIYTDNYNNIGIDWCEAETLTEAMIQFCSCQGNLKISQNIFEKAIINMTDDEMIQFYNDLVIDSTRIVRILTDFTIVYKEGLL